MADQERGFSYLTILVPAAVVALFFIAGYFVWQAFSPKNTDSQNTQNNQQQNSNELVYSNAQFGFQLTLPKSWAGYITFLDTWEGRNIATGNVQTAGPKVVVRNPNWKSTDVWQDIPILIFKKADWNLVESEQISLGAAPIGPSKLGENQNYVFALPARWVGFTDAKGQQEAQQITQTFKAF